jgi:hypothetical protein
MKLARLAFAAAALLIGIVVARGGGVPPMPNQAPFNDPSQSLQNMQQLIQQLNGFAAYAPVANIGLGQICAPAAGASPQTCNGQRGAIPFTGITVTTTGTTQTLTINNSLVNAGSLCNGTFVTAFTAGSAVSPATWVAGAGALTVVISNGGTTANAVTTGTLAFHCFN